MTLLSYVPTYHDIRALLGVSSEELEDDTLATKVYVRGLEETLNEVDPDLVDQFITVSAIASSSRTKVQARFFAAVQSFSTYQVADDLTISLPQFSPKSVSDGKAVMQRHADGPYKLVIEGIKAGRAVALQRLRAAFAAATGGPLPATTPTTSFLVSPLASDPVTGA